MPRGAIISQGQARTILRKTLHKAAVKKRATELESASKDEREKILKEIDQEVNGAMKEHAIKHRSFPWF